MGELGSGILLEHEEFYESIRREAQYHLDPEDWCQRCGMPWLIHERFATIKCRSELPRQPVARKERT